MLRRAPGLGPAPSAAADVTDLEVLPGLSVGAATPFGAGCTYLVVAETSDSVGTPSDKGVGIVDYNRASSFPLQSLRGITSRPTGRTR